MRLVSIVRARSAQVSLTSLVLSVVLLASAGCGGSARESPTQSLGAPEPTLFLAGAAELTVVDVDSGRAAMRPLAELAPGDPPYRIVRRGNLLVFWGRDTYVLDPDLRSPPRKLGDSWFFIPSAKPGRVWLAILNPDSPETERALSDLREVSLDGRVTLGDVHPPGGRWPVAAVGDDLVFEDNRGGLELWNPASGEITRRLPGASLGPSQGDLLAWCERDGRTLHVLDVGRGRDQVVVPRPGFAAFDCASGAFSPDGRSLAVAATAGGYEAERSLALVDLAHGVARRVEGSTVHPDYVFIAWSTNGNRVFLSGGPEGDRHLLQYRLGEPRAVPLPVEVRDFYGMAAR